jgi:hypothetical protein
MLWKVKKLDGKRSESRHGSWLYKLQGSFPIKILKAACVGAERNSCIVHNMSSKNISRANYG